MSHASKQPLFDSTIFVITADHAYYERGRYNLDPKILHIPLLIYAPALIGDSSRINHTYGGQVDFIPTIMGILGGDYLHGSWGRDLLNLKQNDHGYAIFNIFRRIGILNNQLYYYESLGQTGRLKTTFDLAQKDLVKENAPMDAKAVTLQNRLYRYMQTAEQLSTPIIDSNN